MTDWIATALGDATLNAATTAVGRSLLAEINGSARPTPNAAFDFVTQSLELAAFGLIGEPDKSEEMRSAAELAFEHIRTLRRDAGAPDFSTQLLHTACYGVLADRTPDVSRFLKEAIFPEQEISGLDWGGAVRQTITIIWLKLLRKDGWKDLDAVLTGVVSLREAQAAH